MNNVMPQSQVDIKTWTVSQWINKLGATLQIRCSCRTLVTSWHQKTRQDLNWGSHFSACSDVSPHRWVRCLSQSQVGTKTPDSISVDQRTGGHTSVLAGISVLTSHRCACCTLSQVGIEKHDRISAGGHTSVLARM